MLRSTAPRSRGKNAAHRNSHHTAKPRSQDLGSARPHCPGLQHNYDNNHDGPVWDRWDTRSQSVITRAEYIRRHAECATAPQGPAHVESAAPGQHGAWLVRYEIGGQQLTDHWYYIHRRWEFDLLLSNPGAARLYRLPFAKYATQTGCADH